MKFTVLWQPAAEQDLADLWMASADKSTIATAANQLDQDLAEDAQHLGESRGDNMRIAFESPLGKEFLVKAEDCQVLVLGVWMVVPGK